jgi:hypothetical protein
LLIPSWLIVDPAKALDVIPGKRATSTGYHILET